MEDIVEKEMENIVGEEMGCRRPTGLEETHVSEMVLRKLREEIE